MKKILVTGGAGFIGSHLCYELINKKNYVYCLDNLSTGKIYNINNIVNNKNFKYLNHDITEPIDLEIDEIYNLACPASPIQYQNDPIKTIKTNVLGTINVLELATRRNATILQASTSEIYGDPVQHPQKENYWGNVNPIGIRSCYDEGKRCAETLCFDYKREKKTKIKIVRIFNTYGSNMSKNDGRVISNFINQAIKNNDITIYGTGEQTRSFCYVSDLVSALILMMNTKLDFTGPINIGNPNEKTILEIADRIISLSGSKSKKVFVDLPSDDPLKRCPDIALALKSLKWQPKVNLEDGLKKTISYFRNLV